MDGKITLNKYEGTHRFMKILMSLFLVTVSCNGHGRLIRPPSRVSAWRFGFHTPVNYNDNESNCGGFSHQWLANSGKCGVCGDSWSTRPRPQEAGGKYAKGIIVANYTQAETINVEVDITANHRGRMEFRICPTNNKKTTVTQRCLNRYPLNQANNRGFFYKVGTRRGKHHVKLKLPEKLICKRCVLQWRYVAGNNWGYCKDGSSGLGCGPQEEFRACADVSISSIVEREKESDIDDNQPNIPKNGNTFPAMIPTSSTPSRKISSFTKSDYAVTTIPLVPTTTASSTIRYKPYTKKPRRPWKKPSRKKCIAVHVWKNSPGMKSWCQNNCNHVPSFCPASHCVCQ